MKCNRCGNEISTNESFCLYCGNELKNDDKTVPKIKNKKMKKQKNHIEEEDNTFFVAGAVAIFLVPIIILGIKMANYYYNQTPSVEPLGSFPELFKAAIFYLIVITAIPIPIIIVIIGAFTGCFRKKKSENNNTKQTE